MGTDSKFLTFPPDFLVNQRYRILKPIGKGSFGEVFMAIDLITLNNVAIKIESCKKGFSQLTFESKVYRYLADGINIPCARLFNIQGDRKALVMDLLGPSLEDMHKRFNRKFSIKTVCILADKMLNLLEFLHIRSIIHRDIKPDNFLTGLNANANRIYVVDFGLAKQYCVSRVIPHVKYNNNKCMVGTARYASINAHLGIEQSRRDDLESLGYVLLYFYLGQLPWQGISGETKHLKYDRICERKLNIQLDVLCKNCPLEFISYFNYVRNLRFDEKPDYTYLRQLFRTILRNNDLSYDSIFDWTNPEISRNTTQVRNDEPIKTIPTQIPVTTTIQKLPQLPTTIINKTIASPCVTNTQGVKTTRIIHHQSLDKPVLPTSQPIKLKNTQPNTRVLKTINSKDIDNDVEITNNTQPSITPRYNLRSYKTNLQKNQNTTNQTYTSKRRGTVSYENP